jgi:uncharacterized protein
MNEMRSRDRRIPAILPRAAGPALTEALTSFPAVVVIGARQTGKSTLVQTLPALADRLYLTLDDFDLRDQAGRDPASILARGETLIIDEVQRAPDVLLAVKQAIDRDRPRRPGRFVLTGSANLLLMQRVAESLAGRAYYLKLWPLTRRERLGKASTGIWSALLGSPVRQWEQIVLSQDLPSTDWHEAAALGGLPVPAHEMTGDVDRARWFDGYIDTYLERDLQVLAQIGDLGDFRRLMRTAALHIGTTVNQTDLARDIGVSRPTTHRWLNLLETSFQLYRVPAFAVNRSKRLVKSPKLYWSDVGLALHLAGGEVGGAHLENLIACDLIAWRELNTPRPEVCHWRTANQEEVDFVIETGRRLLPIEVKATTRPTYQDARHLLTFRAEYGRSVCGCLLLHGGDETFWLADGVLAAPWWRVV